MSQERSASTFRWECLQSTFTSGVCRMLEGYAERHRIGASRQISSTEPLTCHQPLQHPLVELAEEISSPCLRDGFSNAMLSSATVLPPCCEILVRFHSIPETHGGL